jgi:hypothetical protein
MSHTIHYNPQDCMIEVTAQGVVNREEFGEIFAQAAQLAKEKDCLLFLNDFRGATLNVSTLDIYDLPKSLDAIATPLGLHAERFKRALVIAPKHVKDASFAEDVTVNRGQQAKFFQDIDEARTWLLGK